MVPSLILAFFNGLLAADRHCSRAYVLRRCLDHGLPEVVPSIRRQRRDAPRAQREGIAAVKRRIHQMLPPPA